MDTLQAPLHSVKEYNLNMIFADVPLGSLSTWNVPVVAAFFTTIRDIHDLPKIKASSEFIQAPKHHIIGSGANTLFTSSRYEGIIIHNKLSGITQIAEDNRSYTFLIGAGEDWHTTIQQLIHTYDAGGMENLAYIPGTFGAAPIQNVAAYGQALEDVFEYLEAYEWKTGKIVRFDRNDAQFRYRSSSFKSNDFRTRFVITSVAVRLHKKTIHRPDISYYSNYESLKSELPEKGPYTLKQIFDAVTHLRKKKLPELPEVGTNGSTFMNPLITGDTLAKLLQKFPKLQYYPVERMQYTPRESLTIEPDRQYKIAAGHIFDTLGWKGKIHDGVGTWKNHALIVCNYSGTRAEQIWSYINKMQAHFFEATGIHIEPEINIIS
jgi:UDP-N-acetylmuramate dehydrogenase